MKKLSLVVAFCLACVNADSVLSNQLFWDCASASDYASHVLSHPSVPEFPENSLLNEVPQYRNIRSMLDSLRSHDSRAKIFATGVREECTKMKSTFYFYRQVVLKWFGKGLISKIEGMLKSEDMVSKIHKDLISEDFQEFFLIVNERTGLDVFSGKIVVDGKANFADLKIRSESFSVGDFDTGPVIISFSEPGCFVSFDNKTHVVPEYVAMNMRVTLMCSPDQYYAKDDLKFFIINPRWNEGAARTAWLYDLNAYLDAANDLVSKTRLDALRNFDGAESLISEANVLNALLNQTEVSLALSQLSDSSKIASFSQAFDISDADEVYGEMKDALNYFESSGSLGEKYQGYADVISKYSHFSSLIGVMWSSLQEKISAMEELCRKYGGECEYKGGLSYRLVETSKTFLELRVDYLQQMNLASEAMKLKIKQAEARLSEFMALLVKTEPYLKVSEVSQFKDKFLSLKSELSLVKATAEFSGKLSELLWKIEEEIYSVTEKFFVSNREKAVLIKSELIHLSGSLVGSGVNVVIEDRELSAFSKNIVDNLIYYLSREEYLEELNSLYKSLVQKVSSNLPSNTICEPRAPVIGREFTAECVSLVNNSLGIPLNSASSVLTLPFSPIRINSGNFFDGISFIESVSFSGSETRVNLKNIQGAVALGFSFSAIDGSGSSDCYEVVDGLVCEVNCNLLVNCSGEKGFFPLPHPFSGRKMNSTLPYTYNGEEIFVEVLCNGENFVKFTGPSVEIRAEKGKIEIENLLNSTIEFVNEFPAETPVVFGTTLLPFEKKSVSLDVAFSTENAEEAVEDPKPSLIEIMGFSDFKTAAESLFASARTEFGCVEENIVSEVSKNFRVPKLSCIRLSGIEKAQELYNAGEYEGAVKAYLNTSSSSELEAFLSRSLNYQGEAKDSLEQAKAATSEFLPSKIAGVYVEKATAAYDARDYITSVYYSKYAVLRSAVKLGFDFRTLIAVAVIGYGIYSMRKKKEEELI